MPSGLVHARDSRLLAIASLCATPVAVAQGWSPIPPLLVAAGCIAGIPLTPDLDHHNRTYAESLFVLGKLWQWFWLPYEKLIPHRSHLSHAPLLGTALRQLYLFSVGWLVAWGLGGITTNWFTSLLWLFNQWWYQWWLLGLVFSDTMHWAQDMNILLRWFRKRRRRQRPLMWFPRREPARRRR